MVLCVCWFGDSTSCSWDYEYSTVVITRVVQGSFDPNKSSKVPYFSGDYPHRVLSALVKFMVQKTCNIIVALKRNELKGVALVMTFFTRYDEKRGINESKVNWRHFLILNEPIKMDMQGGDIYTWQFWMKLHVNSLVTWQHTAWYSILGPNRNSFKIYAIIETVCFLCLNCTVSLKLAIR